TPLPPSSLPRRVMIGPHTRRGVFLCSSSARTRDSATMTLQTPTPMPFSKYKSFQERIALDMRARTWPDQIIRQAPRWLSTDLRDGKQALTDPMTPDCKRKKIGRAHV